MVYRFGGLKRKLSSVGVIPMQNHLDSPILWVSAFEQGAFRNALLSFYTKLPALASRCSETTIAPHAKSFRHWWGEALTCDHPLSNGKVSSEEGSWAPVCSRQTSPFTNGPYFKPTMLLRMTACGWAVVYQMEHCRSSQPREPAE